MEWMPPGNPLNPSFLHQLSPGEKSRKALLSISATLELSDVVFSKMEAKEELLEKLDSNKNLLVEVRHNM